MKDQELLKPLVNRLLELSSLPVQENRKKRWADHQALIKTAKTPVSVYWEGIPKPQWEEIFGRPIADCVSETGREVEFFLRRVIWTAEHIPDDHIVWPLTKLLVPMQKKRGWGLSMDWVGAHSSLEAAALATSMKGPIDTAPLTEPIWEVDEAAWKRKKEEALTLTEGRLDIYPYFDHLGYSPFDIAADMRGLEQIMMDALDDPEGLAELMNFITVAMEKHHLAREKNGWINHQILDRSGRYQPVLEHRIHCVHSTHGGRNGDPIPRLRHEWPYVSAQTSSGFGPDMYEEFVHPYNAKLAAHFSNKTVYYHGCETLDQKLGCIQNLPNLRRQHVSPWSTVAKAVEVFQGSVVMEVHANPSLVFFGWGETEIRANLKDLFSAAKGMPLDLNLSDIHTVNHNPALLGLWAKCAQEVVG